MRCQRAAWLHGWFWVALDRAEIGGCWVPSFYLVEWKICTSQKPFCVHPKLSNVRPLWVNIAHCPSVPRHPPKMQSLSKLSEGLKFAYTGHHTIENHLNIIDELYAILCGGRKKVTCNSYVGCGTKAPVGQNVSRTMRFSAPISVTVYNIVIT